MKFYQNLTPHREDKHELTPNLWKQFNQGFYPLPRKDK